MIEVRLSAAADADIIDILTQTSRDFGIEAFSRYERLVVVALKDLAQDCNRNGTLARPELGPGVHSYHLRHSSARAT